MVAPAVAWIWATLGHPVPRLSAPQLLLRLGLYAVLEEIVFRGALQPWLATRPALANRSWLGISSANALTSLLFAAAHGIAQPLLQVAAIVPVSLVFGLALEHSRQLAAPIGLHLYFNGLLWAASVLLIRV
ncbi:MAG: JDVT-CTERM system glutamic-type intramembrane protease [Ideonella sp.]